MCEEHERIDFEKETILDEDILPQDMARPLSGRVNVLLTGATGFLGSAILYELLEQTDYRIWCLVRGDNAKSSLNRLHDNMKKRMLWTTEFEGRVHVVVGDLSRPRLGVSASMFEQLGGEVHVIYHAGAKVNVLLPYSMLSPTNVYGTKEILRLATIGRTKPVHYVSTAAILIPGQPNPPPVQEDTPLVEPPCHIFSYIHSKWISEKLLVEARRRGIPVAVYRPTIVGWHGKSGVFNSNDLLGILLRSCLAERVAPNIDWLFDIVPLDYAARSLVHIARQPASLDKNFNITATRPMCWTEIVELCNVSGFRMEIIPYTSWFERIKNNLRSPIYRIGPTLPSPHDSASVGLLGLLRADRYPILARHNFATMTQSLDARDLVIDQRSLRVYLAGLQSQLSHDCIAYELPCRR